MTVGRLVDSRFREAKRTAQGALDGPASERVYLYQLTAGVFPRGGRWCLFVVVTDERHLVVLRMFLRRHEHAYIPDVSESHPFLLRPALSVAPALTRQSELHTLLPKRSWMLSST